MSLSLAHTCGRPRGRSSKPPLWPGPLLVFHPSRGRRRRRPRRLAPIDVGRQFLVGPRRPPEGRGGATDAMSGEESIGLAAPYPHYHVPRPSVRTSEVDRRVRLGLSNPKISDVWT